MDNYSQYVGKVLDKRYKILEAVGVGGMAFVLKAEDLLMNRLVALKILSSEYNGDEPMQQRFINESKAVAMLSHKNIVSVYDVAIYTDMKYIVMEFLDGITLKEYMDKKGVLSWKEACYFVMQILKALEHAHSRGVVHRDIKPQNIMVQKNGEIKVTDFGIAKLPGAPSLTLTEKAIGTVYYISPEQACGKATDFHSDLYSVGIMLYEACTGCLPFVSDSAVSVAMLQLNAAPKAPIEINPSIPGGLNQIILKAMEKNPAERFQSAHGMLKSIEVLFGNPEVVFTTGVDNVSVGANTVNIDLIDTASLAEIALGEGFPFNPVEEIVVAPSNETAAKDTKRESGAKKRKKKGKRSLFTKKSHSMFPIITGIWLAAVIVLAVIGGYMFVEYFANTLNDPDGINKTVTIPKLIGLEWNDELAATLSEEGYEGAKFKILDENIEYKYNPLVEKGHIISQFPAAGTEPKAGKGEYWTEIKIVVSSGAKQVVFEELRGLSKGDAESWLHNNGVSTQSPVYREDELHSNNQVIDVLDEGGVAILPGDIIEEKSKVTLVISKVSYDSVVPDVRGKTLDEARELIMDAGFSVGIVATEPSDKPDDTVLRQSSEPNQRLIIGTIIDLTVSKQIINMISLIGLSETDAISRIIQSDLKYGGTEYRISDAEAGTVIDQNIAADSPVQKGDTIVITVAAASPEASDGGESGINGSSSEYNIIGG